MSGIVLTLIISTHVYTLKRETVPRSINMPKDSLDERMQSIYYPFVR